MLKPVVLPPGFDSTPRAQLFAVADDIRAQALLMLEAGTFALETAAALAMAAEIVPEAKALEMRDELVDEEVLFIPTGPVDGVAVN